MEPGLSVYPNPSRAGGATVALTLAAPGDVRVEVYDVLGRPVATLHDGRLGAGAHELTLDGATLTPGVYLVRATVSGPDGATEAYTRRITLVE